MRKVWKSLRQFSAATCALTVGATLVMPGEAMAVDGGVKRSIPTQYSYPDPTAMPNTFRASDAPAVISEGPLQFNSNAAPNAYRTGRAVATPATQPMPQGMEFQAAHEDPMVGMHGGELPADCCMGCDRSFYAHAEALWIRRSGDNGFSLIPTNNMGNFGYDVNGRYTVGQMFDCTDGVEFSFTGPLSWNKAGTVNGANLGSNLTFGGNFNQSDLDAFNLATTQVQEWRAKFMSYEFNRRWWAWDALSTVMGARVIHYTEKYALGTASPVGTGAYLANVKNHLVGMHIGGDFYYPYSHRLSFGSRLRAGVYGNFNNGRTFISKGNRVLSNQVAEDFDISGVFEYGSLMRYTVRSNIVATAGYEVWYAVGVATVPKQRLEVVSPITGRSIYAKDDVFFHGATAGLEMSF